MSQTPYQDWRVERHDAIAVLRIDRVAHANAARPQTMDELCDALATAAADDTVRAVVLTHAGPHFMAGADRVFLADLIEASAEAIEQQIYRRFQAAARALYDFPKPTVAAIGGAAITVGTELAIACDFRVVTPAARFQESWIAMGLIPPLGGLQTLQHLVGSALATDMVLRGRAVRGEEAVARGLAQVCVAPERLEAEAMSLATELAALPTAAYRAARDGLRRARHCELNELLAWCRQTQAQLIQSDDFRQRASAFKPESSRAA